MFSKEVLVEKSKRNKIVESNCDTTMDTAAGDAFVAGLAIAWMTGIMSVVFLSGLAILIAGSWKVGAIVMAASFICWASIYRWIVRSNRDGY